MDPIEKKPNRLVSTYCWWKIDEVEKLNQIANYNTLSIWKSARKSSALLLVFSGLITLGFFFAGSSTTDGLEGLIDVALFFILAPFVYQGRKPALMIAMLLWTIEKLASITNHSSPVIQVIWWALYMKAFYMAYTVGRNPTAIFPAPAAAAEAPPELKAL
jgi:hypothetical protein